MLQGLLVPSENSDPLVFLALPEQKEIWAEVDQKEVRVYKDPEANLEKQEGQESLVRWGHLEKTV